jgi:hypothetical protein
MDIAIIFAVLRSKTVWYAILIAVLSVLQGFIFAIPVAPHWQAAIGCGIAVGIVVLRAITTQPLAAK